MGLGQKKQILGLIPARLKSSRLPHKPLIKIQGKTLLEHTYSNVNSMNLFDRIVILADDPLIEEEAKRLGAECYLTPTSCDSGMQRAAFAHSKYPELFESVDIIAHIQCDEPSVSKDSLMTLIDGFCPDCAVTTLCAEIDHSHAEDPSNVKCVFDTTGKALYFSRSPIPMYREGEKGPYHKHIGIYAYTPAFLTLFEELESSRCESAEMLEHLKILEHGHAIRLRVVDDVPVGIDTEADVKQFEDELCQLNTFL